MARTWLERQERLLGAENCEVLSNIKIMVCGLGGVGGSCCEALCRAGVGTLILIDNDSVSESNINRQAFATIDTVGVLKTDAAKKRLVSINPDVNCILECVFLTQENIPELIAKYKPDYVIDAIDNVTAKVALAKACDISKIPIIASMGTGNKINPEKLKITDISKTSVCPLARVMRKKIKESGIRKYVVLWSDELPIQPSGNHGVPASVSFVPPVAGIMIAGRVIRDILNI